MNEPKIWEPIEELEVAALGADGEVIQEDDCEKHYSSTIIGHSLGDAYGYSLMEICTGQGREADEKLAQLVLSSLKSAAMPST